MASNKQQEEAAAEMRLLLEGTPEQKIRAWLEPTINKHDGCFRSGNWMADLVPYVTVHSLSPETNTLTLHFTPQSQHCNRHHMLHGGAMATLFDFLTTLALCFVNDKPGFWRYLGVTRTLNTTYFRPVAVGDVVAVEVSVMQVGKKLATLKGEMRRLRDGALMAVCEHGKVNTDADYAKAKL